MVVTEYLCTVLGIGVGKICTLLKIDFNTGGFVKGGRGGGVGMVEDKGAGKLEGKGSGVVAGFKTSVFGASKGLSSAGCVAAGPGVGGGGGGGGWGGLDRGGGGWRGWFEKLSGLVEGGGESNHLQKLCVH